MLNKIKGFFKRKPRISEEERYLAQATSLEDLERRIRELDKKL